jgi:putative zinc finger protein
MNCERCQELVSDLLDGALGREDELSLNLHLEECFSCANVRRDLESIIGYCRAHRGEYSAPPHEQALWVRIRNTIEAERDAAAAVVASAGTGRREGFWTGWMGRSWELSFPQLAASVAAIAVVISLATAVGVRGLEGTHLWSLTTGSEGTQPVTATAAVLNLGDRMWQQRQAINYWNRRIELNKARWSPTMRETFDRNMSVIDQAVNDSLGELGKNPHDEVSEEILNSALNEKIALMKEFSDL